jgi:hypothetical protein
MDNQIPCGSSSLKSAASSFSGARLARLEKRRLALICWKKKTALLLALVLAATRTFLNLQTGVLRVYNMSISFLVRR